MHCLACITAGVVEVHSIEAVWLMRVAQHRLKFSRDVSPRRGLGLSFGDERSP